MSLGFWRSWAAVRHHPGSANNITPKGNPPGPHPSQKLPPGLAILHRRALRCHEQLSLGSENLPAKQIDRFGRRLAIAGSNAGQSKFGFLPPLV